MADLSSDSNAFTNAGLSTKDGITVIIGAKVTKIPAYLFYSLKANITSVVFEENSVCKSIGTYAFYECNLTSITIPLSVTSIEKRAFDNCNKLNTVIFKQTYSWTVDTLSNKEFSYADLYDPSTAASYLTQYYVGFTSTRKP